MTTARVELSEMIEALKHEVRLLEIFERTLQLNRWTGEAVADTPPGLVWAGRCNVAENGGMSFPKAWERKSGLSYKPGAQHPPRHDPLPPLRCP